VPRCGALSLLQKTLHYRGGSSRNRCCAERKIVGSAWLTGDCEGVILAPSRPILPFRGASKIFEGAGWCFCTSRLAARCPARVARCTKRAATQTSPGRAAVGPRRGFVPQAPTVQTCVSAEAPAATLRPSTQTRRED